MRRLLKVIAAGFVIHFVYVVGRAVGQVKGEHVGVLAERKRVQDSFDRRFGEVQRLFDQEADG
jgi:hypothetical protein